MSELTIPGDDAMPADAAARVVQAQGLGRMVDDRAILDGVDLEIAPGGFVALLGANGAGKSTLLNVLATLLPRTSGSLSLFGQPVTRNSTALRARVGMIGHQPMLYRDLSAHENLVFFGKLYGVKDAASRAEALLERVGLIDRADDPVKTFSRGMTQRTSIARALMHQPQLLLADEPFAGLDIKSNDDLQRVLMELNQEGHTIVMAHHDLAQSLEVSRRVVILRRGRVALDTPVAQVSLQQVRQEVTRS